jgi:hypothetical protein
MNRRQFIFAGMGTASLLSLSSLRVLGSSRLNDAMLGAAPMASDCDEFPLEAGGRPEMKGGPGMHSVAYNLKYWTSEEVLSRLSPFIESSFEMFFLVNTGTGGNESDFVPFQHIKVVRKIDSSLPAFTRDENGKITGLSENAEIWATIPISSGRGSPHILTYSGIFRFNHIESKKRIGSNESSEAPMSYSNYIDFIYNTGVEARVAIHGTPARNHHLLGKSRASEGCMRVLPKTAKLIRETLLSPAMYSETLPAFDRRSQLPSADLMEGRVQNRPGVKALLAIFNGYQNPGQSV